MALTNAQYDSLMREYNNKQMRNHQIVIQREEELYRAVPESFTSKAAGSVCNPMLRHAPYSPFNN